MARAGSRQPAILANTYRAGMKRDFSRDQMPAGSVWNVLDALPGVLDAPAEKRGGYTYASGAASAITASADHIVAGIWAPFSSGVVNLMFDEDGRGYRIVSSSSSQDVGAVVATFDPVFYSDMVIVPASDGSTSPKKITYNGSAFTVASLGGSPPAGKFAVIYKDVLWLAASSASSDRIFFSTAGQPEDTWDTANKFLDMSFPITGMAALNNAVFVFSNERTARVRGSVPPPDSDFIVDDPIYSVGCTDHRSIAYYQDKVIWANAEGLFISDGSAMDDLTKICGQKTWWLDIMTGRDGLSTGSAYSPSSWTISGAVHRDYYIYVVMNGSTKVDAGMIDLKTFSWMRFSNMPFDFLWSAAYPHETYAAHRDSSRVSQLSDIFVPSASNKNDANGTAVGFTLETSFFAGVPNVKTFLNAFVSWYMTDAASDNPVLTVSYITSPEATSYTDLSPTLAEVTEITRDHLPLNFPAYGLALKIVQANASGVTRLYGIEVDAEIRQALRSL